MDPTINMPLKLKTPNHYVARHWPHEPFSSCQNQIARHWPHELFSSCQNQIAGSCLCQDQTKSILKRESKYIEERRNTSLPMVMVATGPTRERKEDGDCWSSEKKKEEDGNLRKANNQRTEV